MTQQGGKGGTACDNEGGGVYGEKGGGGEGGSGKERNGLRGEVRYYGQSLSQKRGEGGVLRETPFTREEKNDVGSDVKEGFSGGKRGGGVRLFKCISKARRLKGGGGGDFGGGNVLGCSLLWVERGKGVASKVTSRGRKGEITFPGKKTFPHVGRRLLSVTPLTSWNGRKR